MQPRRTLCAAIVLTGSLGAAHAQTAVTCSVEALNALATPRLTVTAAAPIAASGTIPAHCDIRGSLDTGGNTAGVRYQLPETWNRKLLVYGVGGTGGSVEVNSANPTDRAIALARGYATAVTDTGHQEKTGANASFALRPDGTPNQPAIDDYLHRAAHLLTVAGKHFVPAAHAAKSVDRTYFDGCSNGGRMALVGAERYPSDYDGIIAGAPVTSLLQIPALLHGARSLLPAEARVSAAQLDLVTKAYQDRCDAADGVRDGLVQNPARCDFKPSELLCKPGQTSDCLTQKQVDGLTDYARPLTDRQGNVLSRGLPINNIGPAGSDFERYALGPAAPAEPDGAMPWPDLGTAARGWLFGDSFLKYVLFRDPTYDSRRFRISARGVIDDPALPRWRALVRTGDPSDAAMMDGFIRSGRKMIIYHGYGDHALSPMQTIDFHGRLAARHGGADRLGRNVRLFMVPGMQHCGSGPGLSAFNTIDALDAWVTRGEAPATIAAAEPNDRANPAAGTKRSLPLCPFPAQARYAGTGDVTAAANWTCPGGAAPGGTVAVR